VLSLDRRRESWLAEGRPLPGKSENIVAPKERTMQGHIKSAMGTELLVKDVMTKGVISIGKYESVMYVADILSEKNISGLPVVDKENKVLGIITQADILSMIGVSREHTFKDLLRYMLGEKLPERRMGDHVGDIMTSPAITINPGANIAEAVRMMDDRRIRRLTVVDDDNRLIGIITRADILKAVINKVKEMKRE
jgi:CBS domain-containing protein